MLESSDVFDDEDIVDECIDFMIAGTQTTQLTTQFVLSHFMTDPESLARARAEFEIIREGEKNLDKAFREKLTL